VPLLLVAIASFVFVRGESDSSGRFVVSSGSPPVVRAAALERVVRTAPEPGTRAAGRSASCGRVQRFGLRDAWDCTIRYASGRDVTYLVRVAPDGSYRGGDMRIRFRGVTRREDTGNVSGCCVSFTRSP
jgi:hypothetical protein